MEMIADDKTFERQLADRLRQLRIEQGWSLDELAARSAVSRATLSRLEHAEVSATASVLSRLCSAYGLAMSRLMRMVEEQYPALVRRDDQPVWNDPEVGFRRRQISPPAQPLAGEALECELAAGVTITYDTTPQAGMEHHVYVLEGRVTITVEGRRHDMMPGDCLRYQLFGSSQFDTPPDSGVRYVLFMV